MKGWGVFKGLASKRQNVLGRSGKFLIRAWVVGSKLWYRKHKIFTFFFFPFFTPKSEHAKKKFKISKFWIFLVGFLIGAYYLMGSWFLISSKKRTTGLVGPLMGEAGGRGVGTPGISWLTTMLWVTTWKKVTDRLSLFVMEIAAESLTQFITIPPLSAR